MPSFAKQPGVVARKDGDAVAALSRAVTTLEAIHEVPYLEAIPVGYFEGIL